MSGLQSKVRGMSWRESARQPVITAPKQIKMLLFLIKDLPLCVSLSLSLLIGFTLAVFTLGLTFCKTDFTQTVSVLKLNLYQDKNLLLK